MAPYGAECMRVKTRETEGSNLLLLGLLGQEHSLDVRQHTTLGDGHTGQQLVQLLVVADGQLQV